MKTILDEARYRLTCCRAKSGDGWGDRNALRNHLRLWVGPRLHELKPFVADVEALPEDHELRCEPEAVELVFEYHDLVNIQHRMRFYLQIDLPTMPHGHHVLPIDGTHDELCYIIQKANQRDIIHCLHSDHQKLTQTESQQAGEKELTFSFPPPWPPCIEGRLGL